MDFIVFFLLLFFNTEVNGDQQLFGWIFVFGWTIPSVVNENSCKPHAAVHKCHKIVQQLQLAL